MAAKRALLGTMLALVMVLGALAPSSGAQDGDATPPPPPLTGTTQLVNQGDFPAIAYVLTEYPDGSLGGCTGALITAVWVLTAAHCVQDNTSLIDTHAVEVTVLLGAVDVDAQFFIPPGPGLATLAEAEGPRG